jgi:HlyD family secretion protein
MADQDLSPAGIEPTISTEEFLGVEEQPAWRRWLKWGLVGVGAVLLLLLLSHFLRGGESAAYATEPVTRGSLTTSVSATGKLAPTNQVDVGSELSGLVTKVVVDVNDRVTAGQPLALIDPSRYEDAIKQAEASLNANRAQVAEAKATLAQAQAQLDRELEVSRLSGGRVPAKVELEQARADRDRAVAALKSAQANVVSAQAQLSSAQTERTKAVIRSPVNGVVLARQIEPGQTVAASFNTPTLFVIAEDLSQMKLEVAIDEADVGQVKQGQKATFTVDAFPGKTFPATITRVDLGSNLSAQSSSSSSTSTTASTGQVVSYAAELSVANPDLQLRPGMTATADIITSEQKNVLLVPNAALRFTPQKNGTPKAQESGGITGALVPRRRRRGGDDNADVASTAGGKATVYVKSETGQPKPIRITTGKSNGTSTAVLSGAIKPGMEVIVGQLSGEQGVSRRGGGQRSGSGGGQRGQ